MRELSEIPESWLSISSYLDPAWLEPDNLAIIKTRLKAGALIVVRDAFRLAFAERMYQCLDTCKAWKCYEAALHNFHYHHHNLYDKSDYPADLAWCEKIFNSKASTDFVSRLSERDCRGSAVFSASWYLPGDHSLPHNDQVAHGAEHRQVAFIWHLTKNWKSEWGGALFWCPRMVSICPQFNSLILFNVGGESEHFVTAVSPYACGKRLTINGWWTGPEPTEGAPDRNPERIRTDLYEIEVY